MKIKKMNEKKREDMIGLLIIRLPLCSDSMMFFEEAYKKKISISHLL